MSNARGVKELKTYQLGDKISLKKSVLAKCADCMGYYIDGKMDCMIPDCSLYPFMVYGAAWKGRQKKIMSPMQLKAMRQGLKHP